MMNDTGLLATMMLGSFLAVSSVPALAQQTEATPSPAPQAAPASTPAPAAPKNPPVTNSEEWKRAVSALLRRKAYGLMAQLPKEKFDGQFQTMLMLKIAPDGKVIDVKVAKGSGDAAIDAAASRVLSAGEQLPPFTPDMHADGPIRVSVPLRFDLKKPEPAPAPPKPAKAR